MHLYRHLTANNIQLTPMDFIRELSMESYLIENPDVLVLDDDELSTVDILDVELPIKGGRVRKNSDGRIDLLALYGQSTLGVIELKLGELNHDHLDQLEDYLNETNQIEQLIEKEINKVEIKYIGVLVGKTIAQSLAEQISDGYLINDAIPVAALTIKRYKGQDNNIYVITDTYFRNLSRKFDKTKYIFIGEEYGKNRLVYAIIRKYIEDNPETIYSRLEIVFPRTIQGSSGCFDSVEKATEIYNRTGHKRHFIKPEEIIELKDTKIAISTQWGVKNIPRFIQAARDLSYKIIEKKE